MIIIINFHFQSFVSGRKSFYLWVLLFYEFTENSGRFYYHFFCTPDRIISPVFLSRCQRFILLRKVLAIIKCYSYNLLYVLKDEDFCRETLLNPLFLVA